MSLYKSSRHHYIPEHIIKGFINEENKVYIYNKQTKRIQSNPRPPKSIFFDPDRNTITSLDTGEKYSIIEDIWYKKIDDMSSKIFEELRKLNKSYTEEDIVGLDFILINLFWRIPYTDSDIEQIIEEVYGSDYLKNDLEFHKIERMGLYKRVINESIKKDVKYAKGSFFTQNGNVIILGDNLILFKKKPTYKNYIYQEYLFPISGLKMYISKLSNNHAGYYQDFDIIDVMCYNALIVSQSLNFAVSGNKKMLEKSVQAYSVFEKEGVLPLIKQSLFEPQKDIRRKLLSPIENLLSNIF